MALTIFGVFRQRSWIGSIAGPLGFVPPQTMNGLDVGGQMQGLLVFPLFVLFRLRDILGRTIYWEI